MKVEQFLNRNQFRLYGNINGDAHDVLQSYNSKVIDITNFCSSGLQMITLGRDWDYSTTTSKHVYAFLDEYSKVRIYGITNKRKYIRDLIEECKKDENKFYKENHYIIIYDEEMV